MSTHTSFLKASEQAEHSLNLLEDIVAVAQAGHYPDGDPTPAAAARDCLEEVAKLASSGHFQTILSLHDKLAAIAGGGVVRFPSSGKRRDHTSAHEAVRALWLELSVWLGRHPDEDVPADLLERLGIDPPNLRVALRRERQAFQEKESQ
jgi:hypothetical protein